MRGRGMPCCGAVLLAGLLLLLPSQQVGTSSATRKLRQQAGGRRAGFASPDYTLYHRKDDLLAAVHDIVAANPGIMVAGTHTSTDQGYSTDMLAVTVAPGGRPLGNHTQRARLLVDFGEHGRELISSELALLLLHTLASPALVAAVVGGGERAERLLAVLQHVVLLVLPMENVNGRAKVEAGQLCERKNGRGVDTNRNWPIDWGVKEKDYDPNEEFPGREPFSEPEVRIILSLAQAFKPHVWLNVHSGEGGRGRARAVGGTLGASKQGDVHVCMHASGHMP